jgi:hypothetical protein
MKGGGKFADLKVWNRSAPLCGNILKLLRIRKILGLKIKLLVLYHAFRQTLQREMKEIVTKKLRILSNMQKVPQLN